MNYQIIRLREEIEECEKVLAEDRGGYPPPTRRSRASRRHCTFFLAPNHHNERRTVWN